MRETKKAIQLIDHFDEACDGVQQRLIALDLLRERDELRERVARLERQLDAAVKHWNAWESAAASRQRDCDRLRAALEKYGAHLPFCGYGHCQANPCTCGLDAASEGK